MPSDERYHAQAKGRKAHIRPTSPHTVLKPLELLQRNLKKKMELFQNTVQKQ